MKLRDMLERLVWTFLETFLATLIGSPVVSAVVASTSGVELTLSPLGAAALAGTVAGLASVATVLLVYARARLAALPNPGFGLPGLPTVG
jgi:hypothetical protein